MTADLSKAPMSAALGAAALVVAHPDDEVLWFASILRQVGRVIIAFRAYDAVPALGARRAAAMAALPYADLRCLDLVEAGSLGLADWSDPRLTEFGIALDKAAAGDSAVRRYEANHARLLAALRRELAGVANVFTHNPWGEYGHEDHVQVFRVVAMLQREIGFRLWVSAYCSERTARLAGGYDCDAAAQSAAADIDQDYAQRIADIYKRNDCWTWKPNWRWPAREHFIADPSPRAQDRRGRAPIPLAFVPVDGPDA